MKVKQCQVEITNVINRRREKRNKSKTRGKKVKRSTRAGKLIRCKAQKNTNDLCWQTYHAIIQSAIMRLGNNNLLYNRALSSFGGAGNYNEPECLASRRKRLICQFKFISRSCLFALKNNRAFIIQICLVITRRRKSLFNCAIIPMLFKSPNQLPNVRDFSQSIPPITGNVTFLSRTVSFNFHENEQTTFRTYGQRFLFLFFFPLRHVRTRDS